MDWGTIFDEKRPSPGASDAVLKQFVAEIARPISDAEIQVVNVGQADPLDRTWRPIDASKWTIPDRPLPPSYLSFLRWSNGGEFRTGDWLFQFFPALDPTHGVRAMMLAYHIPEYMQGAVPFAFDGCGTFYLFDMREAAKDGEYPVVIAYSGSLGWETDADGTIAASFEAACRGANLLHPG